MLFIPWGSVFAVFELLTFIDAFSRKQYAVRKLDQQVEPPNTLSVGYMPAVGCVGKCLESDCCQATYIKSTSECRIGKNSCCNLQEIPIPGHDVLQLSTIENPLTEYLSVTNGVDKGNWETEEFCHSGHYAIGYKIKGEDLPPADYTATNGIEIICGSRAGVACGDHAMSGNSLWVTFEREITCPEKMFMVSFSMQVEAFVSGLANDNSATNWIKFRCRHLDQQSEETEIEASKAGKTFLKGVYGSWSNSCPVGSAICGIQTRIQPNQGFLDDMALTDVKFKCCH